MLDASFFFFRSFDLCAKSPNDAAMIMLKALALPLMYRYLTVEITRRGQNDEVAKLSEDEDDYPYTEVLEKGM